MTSPRSPSFRPTASAFKPAVLGTRPMETISLSTSSVCAAPLASVQATVTPFLPTLTSPTLTPSSTFRPCLSKAFLASLAICSSTAPRKVGRASSTVTSAPTRRHTLPISRPITPEPIRPSFFGTAWMASAPSLLSTLSSSKGTPGSARALEPVATMICLPTRVSLVAPVTAIS